MEDMQRFDGTEAVTKSEFVYALSKVLKLVELEKASQEDIRVLESLILQYSDELNKIGFDTKTYDDKLDRKTTRLNSSHANISYAVFCLKKKKIIRKTWQ